MSRPIVLYGLIAGFEKQEEILEAARKVRAAGYRKIDGFSPFPVKGLFENLGYRPDKKVQLIFLGAGIFGACLAYSLECFSSVWAWALNIGGKPLNSWPMFIPITFEMTVLCSAVIGFLGMLTLNLLPQPYHPVFNVREFRRASRDRFFLLIEATDPAFDREETWMFLQSLQPYYLAPVPK